MTEYDDFGRPIYETAEEYNRAHKASVNINITESVSDSMPKQSAAKRHATRQTSKNLKALVIGLVVFIIAINVGIFSAVFGLMQGEFHEEGIVEEVELSGVSDVSLPDGFETFYFDGEYYSLPTNYEDILKMGLSLEEGYEEDVLPPGYEELIGLGGEDELIYAMIRLSNDSDEKIPFEKGTVDYFYIENSEIFYEDGLIPDFEFGDGLTFASDYEDVEDYFGTPYYHYTDDSDVEYDIYEWAYYGDDEIHFVSITFIDGTMESVCIEKKIQ